MSLLILFFSLSIRLLFYLLVIMIRFDKEQLHEAQEYSGHVSFVINCDTISFATTFNVTLFYYFIVILQQTSSSYSPVCPGDNVILTCTVTGTYPQWINPVNTENSIILSNSANSGVIGDFTVTFVSSI